MKNKILKSKLKSIIFECIKEVIDNQLTIQDIHTVTRNTANLITTYEMYKQKGKENNKKLLDFANNNIDLILHGTCITYATNEKFGQNPKAKVITDYFNDLIKNKSQQLKIISTQEAPIVQGRNKISMMSCKYINISIAIEHIIGITNNQIYSTSIIIPKHNQDTFIKSFYNDYSTNNK